MKYVGRPKQLVRRSALALAGAAVFTIPALGLVAVGPAQALADEALSQPAALTAPALAGAAQDQEQAQGESQAQTQAESQARAESQAQPQAQDQAQAAESQAQAQPDVQAEPDAQPQLAARVQAASAAEAPGWHSGQGGTYSVHPDGTRHTGWLVTDTYESYGLQRYWMGADGVLRTSSLVDAADAGWWAYARPEGYVVRGKWVDSSSGLVYLADNDGRLEDPGWVVTGSYGGALQRYWVDASSHAAEPGYSQDGWNHYTLADGYVLRGAAEEGGEKWLADNDGLLASGWAVTSAFGGGLQRYWFGADGRLVRGGLVSPSRAGFWACARPEGYVVRGKWRDPETGLVYLADNDGRLADPGWHVTSAYGGGLQRYWVDASAHAAVPGYSADGWAHYTLPDTGFVARNTTVTVSGKNYYADNDGLLSEITGMNGIDIASWQAGIDISALSNTTFVIVKVSEGNYYTNPYWEQWADEVVASGKKLGLYHYAGGTSSADAQAQFFLDRVAKYIGKAVVVLDWEETSNPQFGSGADPTFAQAWTRYVEDKTGVTPWVYVSYGVAKNYSDLGCPLWVAKYAYKYYSDSGEIMTGYVDDPAFEDQVREIGNVVCYQYTSCGGVDGYGKAVDINKFYGAPEDWDKYARATRA